MHLGLISRQTRWTLTLRGWLFLGFLAALTGATLARTIHPFLAVNAPEHADVLVVEGWVQDYAILAAREEFSSGKYRDVFATGGPLTLAADAYPIRTLADLGAWRLQRAGLPAHRVHSIPAPRAMRDRTYASAVALREWLHAQRVSVGRLNIVTEDVHARRTRLLFQAAFGPSTAIGVIAVPNPNYDARQWWRYSEGVRDVLGETISYLYAKFLFSAPAPAAAPAALPAS